MILSNTTSCVSTVEHLFDDMANKETTAVLCIGMEKSKKFGSCPGAQIDATRMHDLLKKYSDDATLLLNAQASKKAVIEKMQLVCQKDLAIIFYSGHGGDQKQSNVTKQLFPEASGKDQFLCLNDSGMLDDEIWEIVSHAKGRVVLIFDCCHSGTMYRTPIIFNKNVELDDGLFGSSEKEEPRLLVISGCPDDTYSYGDANGGIMTNAILKYFKEQDSYADLIRKLKYDKTVKAYEAIQFTEIGKSFKDYLIFK